MQVIAFMDTGTGKTLVAVMLVRHFADMHTRQMKAGVPTRRKIVVCLVPTKILVAQQAAAFRRHTNVAVGEYSGATGVDAWDSERWAKEFKCAPYYLELCKRRLYLQAYVIHEAHADLPVQLSCTLFSPLCLKAG